MSTKRVRFGTHSVKSSLTKGSGTRPGTKAAKKAKVKKKPEWDTTVSDLTVHKLSKEEQEKRRQGFLSKNAEAAKHDLYEKAKGSFDLDVSGNLRPSPTLSGVSRHNRNSSKLTTLHQALHGKELHDVLAESDRALAVVRDLFGDDPKRYTCQPNVTVAPHIITDKGKLERTILESQGGGPSPTVLASPGGIRDDSILELAPRKPALNELPSPTQGETEVDATLTADDNSERAESADFTPHGRRYQPSIDLTRFQKLIESEERTNSTTREEASHHSRIPQSSHTTRSHRAAELPLSGQRGDENFSMDGMSELSSIPPATDGRENVTVDSETSCPVENFTEESVQLLPLPVRTVGRRGTSTQPTTPLVAGSGASDGDQEVEGENKRRHQGVTVSSSLTQHPLHVTHRMAAPPTHKKTSQEVEREGDIEQGHPDKVHGQLHTLEKMVEKLEGELTAYEEANNLTVSLNDITNTPPPQRSQSPAHGHHRPRASASRGSLGSITKSLLSSMTKMMSYLRQSEVQLKGEVAVRVQMLQTMTEQQNLMDTLTADLIKLRSENISLRQELGDLKKTSSEQIRKIQDDFADVHKKLSSLAVSHAHQAPPLSYLQPHLPILPPHLLQTPPTFPSSHAQASTNAASQSEQHVPYSEHLKSPAYPNSSASAHVTVPMTAGGVSAANTPQVSIPGDKLSQAKPCATDSPQQFEPEIKGAAPQYKLLEHGGVDGNGFMGRSEGGSDAYHASRFTKFHSKSPPVSTKTAPVPSASSSLAPPPLSEALRVPGFDIHVPPVISHHQSLSSTPTSTTTVPAMSNTLASRPAFDVEAFINSLRKHQPQLATTSTASTGSHSSSVAMPLSEAGIPVSLSQPHPPSMTQATNLHPSVAGRKERTIPMADLSVSLVSSSPEDDEHDSKREYSETMTETSEQTDSSEQKTNSTVYPPEFQRDLLESEVGSETSGSAHVGLPPGYNVMLEQRCHGQGLADHKLKPAWFALTSHLSHS